MSDTIRTLLGTADKSPKSLTSLRCFMLITDPHMATMEPVGDDFFAFGPKEIL